MLAEMDVITTLDLSDDECYDAVIRRDRRYDGRFVTAVRSTGIFCRPSCPARTPRRSVVTFYPDPASALAAGYRPCKRCTPETQAADIEMVERACRAIQDHPDRSIPLAELGEIVGLTPNHMQRMFKRVTGISPREYAEMCRLDAFKMALREAGSVVEAIYAAGYGSSSSVYETAIKRLGMTPLAFRGGGAGMTVRYTLTDCYLGRLLVGATERGVCAVSIGETDGFLETVLHADYPNAALVRDDAALNASVCGVMAALEGSEPSPEVPLDIQATAFQRRAWAALQAIPRGETRTYGEVAESLGDVKLTRAVAQACAKNPVPILIPCHRVVSKGGNLGGFRWGLDVKKWMLQHENREVVLSA
jgi:AraC family transcriptional regulator, regulatory protein of adaptative response / methylated-DNA-[protein]-cysteine methyltransferase